MTLKAFFELLAANPFLILAFFILIPVTAALAMIMGKNEGHLSPWKYLYSTLIYLVCIPGIFSITLSIYVFLFEKRSIFDTDIYTQILPIVSMIATLLLIQKNVRLERIPGFGKMSGLLMMITAALTVMWIVDKTRILVFSYLPFQYVLLIFAGLMLIFRLGFSQMFSNNKNAKP